MKRLSTAVLASLVGLGLFAGCGDDNRPQARNRGDVRVVLPESSGDPNRSASYDFGSVPVGTSRVITLKLRNVGPDDVAVTRTRFENAPSGAFFAQSPEVIESRRRRGQPHRDLRASERR